MTVRGETASIKVTGPLSTNHGEVAVQWALAGRGIVLRSMWDVRPLLESGALVQVLPEVTQSGECVGGVSGAGGGVGEG